MKIELKAYTNVRSLRTYKKTEMKQYKILGFVITV